MLLFNFFSNILKWVFSRSHFPSDNNLGKWWFLQLLCFSDELKKKSFHPGHLSWISFFFRYLSTVKSQPKINDVEILHRERWDIKQHISCVCACVCVSGNDAVVLTLWLRVFHQSESSVGQPQVSTQRHHGDFGLPKKP